MDVGFFLSGKIISFLINFRRIFEWIEIRIKIWQCLHDDDEEEKVYFASRVIQNLNRWKRLRRWGPKPKNFLELQFSSEVYKKRSWYKIEWNRVSELKNECKSTVNQIAIKKAKENEKASLNFDNKGFCNKKGHVEKDFKRPKRAYKTRQLFGIRTEANTQSKKKH